MLDTIKDKLRPIKTKCTMIYLFYKEAKRFFVLLIRHNASVSTTQNIKKMQYALLRENHTIEKGMSMKSPRKGFGQEKALKLLQGLQLYQQKYGNNDFLDYPIATMKSYIELTKNNGIEIPLIESKFDELCKLSGINSDKIEIKAGIKEVKKEDIWNKSKINFEDFVNVRHSIRYFANEIPDINIINKALTIAQRTPSACNRQSWYSYIFEYDKTQELLAWQGGAKGFEKDIPMAILVTTSLNAFMNWEPYQAYVDGGMYAMSLIYALHSEGLGTIPLSTGFSMKQIKKLHKQFNIPESEVPIVIIGIGNLLDRFNIAISERKQIKQTTIYS